jgi:hypothetical protein
VRRFLGRAALATGGINLALAVALVIVSFEPLRSRFGRATGWWHPCLPVGGDLGLERWSPILLLFVAVPVCLGVIGAVSAPSQRARVVACRGAVVLTLVGVVLVFVSFGSCIE